MITSRRGGCWNFLRVFNSWLIPAIFSSIFYTDSFFPFAAGGSLGACWGWMLWWCCGRHLVAPAQCTVRWMLRASPLPCPIPTTPGCSLTATAPWLVWNESSEMPGQRHVPVAGSSWQRYEYVLIMFFGQVSLRTECCSCVFVCFPVCSSLLCAEGALLLPFLVLPPALKSTGSMVGRDQIKYSLDFCSGR